MDNEYPEMFNEYYDGNLGPIINEKKNRSSIEIDFSGEELVTMGNHCIKENLTFSEFIDLAIKNYISDYKKL